MARVLAVAVVVVGAFVGNAAPLGLRFSLPPPPLGTPKKYELAPGETVLISPCTRRIAEAEDRELQPGRGRMARRPV